LTHDLVVTHAHVVTVDAADTVISDGAVAISDGRIVRVGPAAEIGRDAREVVDARGLLLMPGLVNTHCHAADSLFRGLIEDLPLEPWLSLVWKAEGAILSPATVRLGATLGLAELLRGGVTTTMDFFWHPAEGVAAARSLGVRVATGGMFFDGPAVDGIAPADRLGEAAAFFDAFADADDVFPGCFPHGAYTVGPDSLVAAKRLADARGGLFSVHAAETRAERETITARYGRSVIRHLDALGILDARTVLAHCVWLDDEEIEILAQRGASVAHNPMSNLKLASGIARVPDMLRAGVRVTLGTDGAISGNDLDMWMTLRLAATLHRAATLDATAVSIAEALRMATIEGAAALGVDDRLGSLEPGKFADMVLVDLGVVNAAPLFDPRTHLVFSCAKADVRDVYVGGRAVLKDGAPVRVSLSDTLEEVAALTPRIAASIHG
jgi:5-methylthioadenosine/S-adenosylhomocysteine deaminase